MKRVGLISRIAVFSALIYVLGLATVYLPNVNLVFFVVFSAGLMWGLVPGMLVGAVGMGLWTWFNPYGPAAPPIMIAQVVGAAGSGLVGWRFDRLQWPSFSSLRLNLTLLAASVACGLIFFAPVTVTDAWLFQPFWERLILGMPMVGLSVAANAVIFLVLFRPVSHLYRMERSRG